MKYRSTLVLLILAVIGGLWIWLGEPKTKTTEEVERAKSRLFAWKSEDVKKVELKRDSATIVLERDDKDKDTWRLTQPIEAKAERSEVDGILSRLEFLERKNTIQAEGGKAVDLHEYGLDKPRLELTLTTKDAKATPQSIQVGADGVGTVLYLRLPATNEVVTVDKSLWSSVDKKVDELRDKSVADVEAYKVTRLELKYPDRTIALTKADDTWSLTSPVSDFADSDKINKMMEKLRSLKAEKVVADKPGDLGPFGLTTPRLQLTVSEGESKNQTVQLGGDIPDSGGLVYAKNAGSDSVFGVKESVLKELTVDSADLRSKKIAAFETFDATKLEVKRGDATLVVEKKDGKWTLTKPTETKADEPSVTGILDKLKALTVKRFLSDKPSADELKTFGFDPGVAITVTTTGGKTTKLTFGGKDAEGKYACVKRGDLEPVAGVDPSILDALPTSALSLRDHELLDISRSRAQKILIDRDGEKVALEKHENETWVETEPVKRDTEKDAVDAILTAISPLKAKDLVSEKPSADELRTWGLDTPALAITISADKDTFAKKEETGKPKPTSTDDKRETWKLLVGSGTAEAGRYAKIDGNDLVFRMPQTFADALKKDFLKRDLWDLDRDSMTAIKVDRGGATFTAKKDKDGWMLTAPVQTKCDVGAVDNLLRTVAKLRADKFVAKPDAAATKLDAPECTVTVTLEKLAGTEDRVVKIGAAVEGSDAAGSHYASASGEALTFTLAASSVQALTHDLVPTRPLDTFTSMDDVKSIEIVTRAADDSGNGTIAYERGDDKKWKRTKPDAADATDDETQKLQGVLGALAGLRASSIASYDIADPTKFGLDQPRLTITLEQKSGKSILKVGSETKDKKGDGSFASVDGKPFVYVLSKPDIQSLHIK
ncbi:MAG: DUF4340 domain-containing protein [Planctomycetes bacterium]|nr:DUF4340 domain-containing protein [Planctomycetota bacterium]MBI3843689.1 DUF4340 domain-containing protein [Planctomycetota bacterium]